ncbi:MAG TPA: rod shape-determining protein MreC [Candidatus Peregrinibacteria bacterium]|nr:rod shape-determining protein MreC [Candidatus Peregrinibacteria bacterium]
MFSGKKTKKNLLIGGIALIVFILIINVFSSEARNFFYKISYPFQTSLWKAGNVTSNFFYAFFKAKETSKEVDLLRKKNQELLAKLALMKEVKNENEKLRTALELNLQKEYKIFLAQIIGKDVNQNLIVIDKGEIDGIKQGMPVITCQKSLIGRIDRVYKNFSKVLLISSKSFSFDVLIQTRDSKNDILGVGVGGGGSKAYIKFIPREKKISENDLVATNSLGGIFPKGLLVGKIKKIKRSDTEAFQEAEVELAANPMNENEVLVITNH